MIRFCSITINTCINLSLDSVAGVMEMLEILPSSEQYNPLLLSECVSILGSLNEKDKPFSNLSEKKLG
jgi:hypothetical protein